MKLYGRTQMLDKYSFDRSFEVMKGLGFDGFEICLENRKWEVRQEILDSEYIKICKNKLTQLNIKDYSFSYHCNYIYSDLSFNYMKKAIKAANELEAKIFIFSGTKKQTFDKNEWKLMINRTRELVKIAEGYNVILANEPEPNFIIGNIDELLELFNEIPSDYLCCNMDLGHAFLCEAYPLEAISKVGKKIVHVHIENMKKDIHCHLQPNEGDMDLLQYLKALKELEFNGGMALDIYNGDYEQFSSASVKYIKDLISKIC